MDTTSLPTGTITFLFTDIEGSTPLWEQHPDAMRRARDRDRDRTRAGLFLAALVASWLLEQASLHNLPRRLILWFRPSRAHLGVAAVTLRASRNACLDAFLALALLEERIEGRLPAWEGIRLVRERVAAGAPLTP
jgi:hypothetical protein